MLFADQPEVSAETTIAAAPEAVWPVITDINLPARHSPEFLEARWIDDGVLPREGARFAGTNEHSYLGQWTTTCTVTELVPERRFEWTVNDLDNPVAHWRFDVEPVEGGTRVTFSARLGPGPSGLAIAVLSDPAREEAIVEHRMSAWRENMARTLEGAKGEIESGAG